MQQKLRPGEDEAKIVADGGQDDIGRIAVAALEMAAAEVSVGLYMTDQVHV